MAVLLFTAQNPFEGNMWDTLRQYVAGISIAWPNLSEKWAEFSDWLAQPRKSASFGHQSPVQLIYPSPDILAIIFAWWITFTIVCTIIMSLGFGPVGIIPGEHLY